MKKSEKKCFILTFKLKTERWQEDILNKRFEIGRQIYNAVASEALKRYNELKKTKHYRHLIESLNHDKENLDHDKLIWKEINLLRVEAGLSEYGLSKIVTPMKQHFGKQINSHIAQTTSRNVWKAFEKLLYGDGKKIHFKRYGELNSLSGKSNATGIIFHKESRICEWTKLKMSVLIDENNPYEIECLKNDIAYCRVLRKYVRNKTKFYIQIVFKGEKPAKRRKSDGSFVHVLGKGDVGLDIGTSTIAYASQNEVYIGELADKVKQQEREQKLLERKIDRSRRATNPSNYNSDGTCKKGKHKWIRSKHYIKLQLKLKEIKRKQKEVRKLQHEILANHLLNLGDTFYVEAMSFKGLAKKSKKTEKNDKGKFKRKKRFGKSLGNRAPAMLLEILNRKLGYFDKSLIKINTFKAKASQFNHIEQTFKKKKLSQRWNIINGIRVQRDMYSAFLIMNINSDLETYDLDKCNSRYDNFLRLHNLEVERLLGNKNLSSIAI